MFICSLNYFFNVNKIAIIGIAIAIILVGIFSYSFSSPLIDDQSDSESIDQPRNLSRTLYEDIKLLHP